MRVGVDIGGTKTQAVAVADDGTVLASRVRPTVRGPRGVLDTAVRAVADVAGAGGGSRAPESVGVGIPGAVDAASGTVRTAVNLDLDALPLGAELARRTGLPVRVENDVKASALGAAQRFGGPAGTVTYLNVGTGVGAATVLRGALLRGTAGWAGELGHLVVEPDGPACGCGQRGCLEAVAGGGALRKRLAALDPPVALPDLCSSADLGGRLARERDRVVGALAQALTAAALAYDPDVIAVGGGVLAHGTGLLPRVLDTLRARATTSAFLTDLAIDRRIRTVPEDWPVAAVGAALVGALPPEPAAGALAG
ncbi:ROK family protein [Cellulomonas hominis]|uniref:ROK family protein n=1 Tax=Cellulomonas hominis TaxID=156981 RepID=UPI001C10C0C9|nr:ROK family protein [Cellulomonas hominis]MBU5422986.1 ROK family protein [Cellulomonas hominis]